MNRTKQVQAKNEKEKEARVPNFQGLQRKSRKYSTSSMGIDQYQKRFYDHLFEKEQRDKHPIFEENEDHTNQEDFVDTYEQEDEVTPKVPAAEVHSPISDPVVEDAHKSKKKIKKLKGKLKTLKDLERFLKNENILIKERNQTLVSENDKLKEAQAQLQEEHELVFHQAFL